MTATTVQETHPILLPQLGFPGSRELQPVSGYSSDQFNAGHFLSIADIRRPGYYTLRDPATPRPEGAYNVLVLTGGRHKYYKAVHDNRALPWQRRLTNGLRDCYVVWGRQGKEGTKMFHPDSPARTSSGRGVVYTRFPVFNEDGRQSHYGWEVARVEFAVLDRQPDRGDKLRLTVTRSRGTAELADPMGHDLYLDPTYDDELWIHLITQAQARFDAQCTDQLDADTEAWRVWFLDQRDKAAAYREYEDSPGSFSTRSGQLGWIQAMDYAEEAWQLAIVLQTYRHMFPEAVPSLDLPADPRDCDKRGYIGPFIYEGTTGGMERRMLEAYLGIRPERREQLEDWMANYVGLASNLRDYTGD